MSRTCLVPGSFDPITKGHMDVIARASKLFDKVEVAVLINSQKSGLFTPMERVALIEKCLVQFPNAAVSCYCGGLLAYAAMKNASVIVRGIRNEHDYSYERDWAIINREQAPDIETLFMVSAPAYASMSSSHVKECARLGYDITPYVPKEILSDVLRKLGGQNR